MIILKSDVRISTYAKKHRTVFQKGHGSKKKVPVEMDLVPQLGPLWLRGSILGPPGPEPLSAFSSS